MNKIKFIIVFTIAFSAFNLTSFSQEKESLPCINKEFSVVLHIVQDSLGETNLDMAEVEEDFMNLNEYFKPICVSFKVCEERIIENWWYDEHSQEEHWEELQVLYHQKNRINIFYVMTIEDPPNMGGYAGLGDIVETDTSGIVLEKGSGTRTLAHEMGHYFGLYHTFEGSGVELVDGSNCAVVADSICDTPADPFVEGSDVSSFVNDDCRFIFMGRDANDDYYDPIVGNVMSYYPEDCDCGFTHEQYMRMANVYLSGSKMW